MSAWTDTGIKDFLEKLACCLQCHLKVGKCIATNAGCWFVPVSGFYLFAKNLKMFGFTLVAC